MIHLSTGIFLGSLSDNWRMEWSLYKYFCSCLGSLSWGEHVNLALNVHVPWVGDLSLETPSLWEWVSLHVLWWEQSHAKCGDGWRKGSFSRAGAKQIWGPWLENCCSSFTDIEEVFFNWEVHHPWFWFLYFEWNFWIKKGNFARSLTGNYLSLEKESTHTSKARMVETGKFSAGDFFGLFCSGNEGAGLCNKEYWLWWYIGNRWLQGSM